MIKDFKSVVLFGSVFPEKDSLITEFSGINFIKCFQTENADEASQILAQSSQSIMFVRSPHDLDTIISFKILHKVSKLKVYYLDDQDELPPEAIEELSGRGIATLVKPSADDLVAKTALVFLGKIHISSHDKYEPHDPERFNKRNSYFSHFELKEGKWHLVASTHEQDPEIESRFGRSWTMYLTTFLRRAGDIKKLEEDEYFSEDYYALIYPHLEGKVPKLSIIHLRKDPLRFDSAKAKALIFLKQL